MPQVNPPAVPEAAHCPTMQTGGVGNLPPLGALKPHEQHAEPFAFVHAHFYSPATAGMHCLTKTTGHITEALKTTTNDKVIGALADALKTTVGAQRRLSDAIAEEMKGAKEDDEEPTPTPAEQPIGTATPAAA